MPTSPTPTSKNNSASWTRPPAASFTAMKKPELQDFGIPPEQYARYQKNRLKSSGKGWRSVFLFCCIPAIVGTLGFFVSRDPGTAIFVGILSLILLAALYLFAMLASVLDDERQKTHMAESSLGIQIEQYEEALMAYAEAVREAEKAHQETERARLEAERARKAAEKTKRKKTREHWRSLRDIPFEQELATLYRQLGYQVQSTPKSGDQGIDLILTKGSKSTIVQCKGQKNRATPAMVRELVGSRVDYGADRAVLACTAGFTQGAIGFAKRNQISLISATEIARMAEGFSQPKQEQVLILKNPVPKTSAGPKCPKCGHETTIQSTKYDRFWRCSRFPNCKFIQRS